jgi:3'-5' exoribonuclease 1
MKAFELLDDNSQPLKSFSFATDGPWDFRDFLLPECTRLGIDAPWYLRKSIDLRALFPAFFDCKRMGLHGMLGVLGLKFEGRQHSGIADARNIARIASGLIQRGCKMCV